MEEETGMWPWHELGTSVKREGDCQARLRGPGEVAGSWATGVNWSIF